MNPFSLQALTPGVVFTGAPGIARVFDNAGTASYGGLRPDGRRRDYRRR